MLSHARWHRDALRTGTVRGPFSSAASRPGGYDQDAAEAGGASGSIKVIHGEYPARVRRLSGESPTAFPGFHGRSRLCN